MVWNRTHTHTHTSKQEADGILENVQSGLNRHSVYVRVNMVGVCVHGGILQVCFYLFVSFLWCTERAGLSVFEQVR